MAPRELRAWGGRSELEPSGVLFLFAAIWLADMAAVGVGNRGFSGEVEILASGQYGSGGYK